MGPQVAGIVAIVVAVLFLAIGQELRSLAVMMRELPIISGPDNAMPHIGRVAFSVAALGGLTIFEIDALNTLFTRQLESSLMRVTADVVVFAVFLTPLMHVAAAMFGRYPPMASRIVAVSYLAVAILAVFAVL